MPHRKTATRATGGLESRLSVSASVLTDFGRLFEALTVSPARVPVNLGLTEAYLDPVDRRDADEDPEIGC